MSAGLPPSFSSAPPFPVPLRPECPPGVCNCDLQALLESPEADRRVLRLTREEEKRLVQRLEAIESLADLRRIEGRLEEQLGIRLGISQAASEVRTLRGIAILVHEQRGLCRKTRQAIAAVRSDSSGWPEWAFTMTGLPAAHAEAVSPPQTEKANGKLDAENTATGPTPTSRRRSSGRGGVAAASASSTVSSRYEPSRTTEANRRS